MSQPVLSAEIVNAAVVAMDKFLSAEDRALSTAEMSNGFSLSSRNLECSFGACNVEPSSSDNALKPVVLGTGIFRKYNESTPTHLDDSAPYETSFDYDVFLGNRPLSDVYVFGAAYAVAYKISSVKHLEINALPFRGGATYEGSPLLMCRTISISEAIDLMNSEYMSDFIITDPGDEVESLELYRFVISVDNYVPGSNSLTEAKIYFSDKRKPRAWGGFAEEISASHFNPESISNWRTQTAVAEEASLSLYNFVSAWVDLTAWSPDFVTYWTTYSSDMPLRLKQYLLDELNIILP